MLSSEARRRLTIVLVGARNPQNIGAAARAMQDFGFSDLRVVNEFGAPFEAAQLEAKSAVGAGGVMRAARLFSAMSEAIADCAVVVGTTAIGGRELKQPVVSLQSLAPRLVAELGRAEPNASLESMESTEIPSSAPVSRVAILFGSEKTGLTNEQLSHCSALLTIPLFAPAGRHLSMNLGQAVAVCLYELSREGFDGARELPLFQEASATSEDRERLTSLLLQAMQACDYTRRFPANARPEVIRALVAGLGSQREIAFTWMGFLKMATRSMRS